MKSLRDFCGVELRVFVSTQVQECSQTKWDVTFISYKGYLYTFIWYSQAFISIENMRLLNWVFNEQLH